MNSHDRRVSDRYWPHAIEVDHDDPRFHDICEWLNKNFGSSSFKRRQPPRWVWRPNYMNVGNFSQVWTGTQFFFRKDKDYTAFLLRWNR
jgi:hypothetical protein